MKWLMKCLQLVSSRICIWILFCWHYPQVLPSMPFPSIMILASMPNSTDLHSSKIPDAVKLKHDLDVTIGGTLVSPAHIVIARPHMVLVGLREIIQARHPILRLGKGKVVLPVSWRTKMGAQIFVHQKPVLFPMCNLWFSAMCVSTLRYWSGSNFLSEEKPWLTFSEQSALIFKGWGCWKFDSSSGSCENTRLTLKDQSTPLSFQRAVSQNINFW